MKLSFPPLEMRQRRLSALLLRLSAPSVFTIVSMLLLTLAPQAVYGQG